MEYLDGDGKPVRGVFSSGIAVEEMPEVRRKAADIRADIERTRQKIMLAVEAVMEKKETLLGGARQAFRAGGPILGRVRRHPVSAAALAGAGVGWLLLRRRRPLHFKIRRRAAPLTPLAAAAGVLLLKYLLGKRK